MAVRLSLVQLGKLFWSGMTLSLVEGVLRFGGTAPLCIFWTI